MKILINEKEYGIIWGLNAIDRFCNVVDMDMTAAITLLIQENSGIKGTIALAKFITCAAEAYAIVNKEPAIDFSYENVIVEIDRYGSDFTRPITDDFFRSYILGKTVAELMGIVLEETNKGSEKPKKKPASKKS